MTVDGGRLPEHSLPDGDARGRIRHDLGTTLIVEAAAGTGKTTMLVARIIALLTAGKTTLRRIVAVTFTEKAAGEMKLRLRTEVERTRREADDEVARQRLDAALAQLEEARIGTIHALASDLLRERPVEARVDPVFQVVSAGQSDAILQRAFEGWYRRLIERPPEGVRRLLCRRPPSFFSQDTARDRLYFAAKKVVEHRDFDAAWRRDPFPREAEVDRLVAEVKKVAGFFPLSRPLYRDYLWQGMERLHRWVDGLERREAVAPRDYDGVESELAWLAGERNYWRGTGVRPPLWGQGMSRESVMAERAQLRSELELFARRSEADIAALVREELVPFVHAYESFKARTGMLDFFDLLLQTRNLLVGDARVRAELQQRFDYVLVDEFQDTDPLQAEVLLLLAAADPSETSWVDATLVPGKLFLVGDPKQSIYRFRRADVTLYQRIKERLAGQGAAVVYLSTSFRAVTSIQSLVNAAFAQEMSRPDHTSQAEYVPLHGVRQDLAGQPAVIALPVPAPYGRKSLSKDAIAASYPMSVGALIDWMLTDSGWTVIDEGDHVPLRPRHICLLFRQMSRFSGDVTRSYTRALEARQIPHVRVGGKAFHRLEEVSSLRTALTAIEWPDDELSVFATLRGPFVALSDEQLLVFKRTHGRLSPTRRYPSDALSDLTGPVAEALALLGELHRGRNRRPIAETLTRFLTATRAHVGLAMWKAGEQRLANVLRLSDMARQHEARGATSFRAFVETLMDAAERLDDPDTPVVEDTTEGVRLLTVHKAKGLEFPVVILCDPTSNMRRRKPDHYARPEERLWVTQLGGCTPAELWDHEQEALQLDEEEAVRLTYVAATRAKDLLVVPVVGDARRDSWLSPLTAAVYPPEQRKRQPGPPHAGCPTFGEDSVCERPPERQALRSECVVPGTQAPELGEHRVVWWDPNILDLNRDVDPARQRNHLLRDDEEGSARGREEHDRWAATRVQVERDGRRASQTVRSITELARGEQRRWGRLPVDVLRVDGRVPDRPQGTRFGSLLHAVLADVPLGMEAAVTARVAEQLAISHGRLLGCDEAEIEAASAAALSSLEHDLMRRAAASPDCRREVPVSLVLRDGALAEGIIDMAFVETAGDGSGDRVWTVVDFKSDQTLDAHGEAYFEQVRYYVDAIERATGDEARGVLLLV